MRTILIFFIFIWTVTLSQNVEPQIEPFDFSVGIGIGNKSHFGNFGCTSNLYFTRRLSLKVSLGVAAINYGGFITSGGTEFIVAKLNRSHFSIGTVYSYIGGGQDILGDDDSNDFVWYFSSPIQCIRSYLNFSILRDRIIISFEAGGSFTISPLNYTFDGPGTETQKQIDNIQRGLSSGWMATISVNGLFSLKKKNKVNIN